MNARYPSSAAAMPFILISFALTACGGGGDDEEEGDPPATWAQPDAPPPTPSDGATVDGVFRDAAVEGLDYSSGALSGTTTANGGFQFEQGADVTFTLGAVTLGTGVGQPFMTSMNLTELGSDTTNQIRNRHRFLQMLDADNKPENGILISEAVRAAATLWTPIDFTTTNLATAVQTIIADASTADGVTHTLPDVATADAHFFRTYFCAFNGLFQGTFSDDDSGVWAFVVEGNGAMDGAGYSNVDDEGFFLSKSGALPVTLFPTFSAGITDSGGSFSGRFPSPNKVLGSWSNSPDSGDFEGARVGGLSDAVYRMSDSVFPVGKKLLMNFEVNSRNEFTGSIIIVDFQEGDGVPFTLTGTVSGTAVTAAAPNDRFTLQGSFNGSAASPRLTGTLRDNVGNRDVSINIGACRI